LEDSNFTKFLEGDLVEFYTEASPFLGAMARYANPGVVVKVKLHTSLGLGLKASNTVYWNDGSFTTEHDSYLRHVAN
jgi:hypothetical protein